MKKICVKFCSYENVRIFVRSIRHKTKKNVMKLTTEFIANNKVNGNFQKFVNYCNETYYIKSITDLRITLKKVNDKNTRTGRFNSGIYWFKNDETMTQWYLNNRIIK